MTTCKACNGSVDWKRESGSGKWQCFNAGTTTAHWDTCSQRKFERIKREGEFFETENATGYFTDLKSSGVQYTMQRADMQHGRHAIKPCGDCVPPWESCTDCPNALRSKPPIKEGKLEKHRRTNQAA